MAKNKTLELSIQIAGKMDKSLTAALKNSTSQISSFSKSISNLGTAGLAAMGALATAVQSGKAIYAGLSNYNGETLEKATAILNELHVPFVINQNRYSIFDRTIEKNGLKETANRLGKGIIAFSPLAQGLLTDRYLHGIPADSRVRTDGRFLKESALTEEKLAQIRALNEIAAARGQTLAEMALAWILKDGQVTSVLIGASRPEQILDNIKALDNTTFTAEELEAIDRASGYSKE